MTFKFRLDVLIFTHCSLFEGFSCRIPFTCYLYVLRKMVHIFASSAVILCMSVGMTGVFKTCSIKI